MLIQGYKFLECNGRDLYSCHNQAHWKNLRLEARCYDQCLPGETHPGEKCRCGIYVCDSIQSLVKAHVQSYLWQWHNGIFVPVLVNIWGKILTYEKGWRAQYAEVTAIFKPICMRCGSPATVSEYDGCAYCGVCYHAFGDYMGTALHATLENFARQNNIPLLEYRKEELVTTGHA